MTRKNEGFHNGEEDDDFEMMTMTVQERRLSCQFRHSLRRGLAFPSNAKGDLTCMDDGEEDDDDGARRTKAFTTVKKMMMTMTVAFLPISA